MVGPRSLQASAELRSEAEHNPLYCILESVKLCSLSMNLTTKPGDVGVAESCSLFEYNSSILREAGRILGDDTLRRVAFLALDCGAVTELIVRETLGVNHTAAVRALRLLRDHGVLLPALPMRRPRGARGGPRVTVYRTPRGTPDQVAAAVELQRRLESPKYVEAARFAQLLLEEYIGGRGEIRYRDILEHVREAKLPFAAPDMAELAAQVLTERGVRVWR